MRFSNLRDAPHERLTSVRGLHFLLAKRLFVVQQRAVRQYLNHPLEQLRVLLLRQQLPDEWTGCSN